MDPSPYKSDYVHANGINLHYLDWGGEGTALIFLTGMGCSAHLFDSIARRFIDSFRVLALTRRGQGASDYPESGYDADTLIDDILDFMDFMGVGQANLAGHSLAGLELTHFAAMYPERVARLVYLDAGFDWRDIKEISKKNPLAAVEPPMKKEEFSSIEEYIDYVKHLRPDLEQVWNGSWDVSMLYELDRSADGKFVEKDTKAIGEAMMETAHAYEAEFAMIQAPVLSFFAMGGDPSLPGYLTEDHAAAMLEYWNKELIPWKQKKVGDFRAALPQARIVEIPNGHHYCFMAHEEMVCQEMRKFLLE